jgi:hypothetical protein
MSDRYGLTVAGQLSLAFGVVALIPALWSFASAIWSAATTGQVMVISVGRYETSREFVSWPLGWARFVGPLVLLAALGARLALPRALGARWWASATLAALALVLLLFSKWFTSIGGTSVFVSILAFVVLASFVDERFGRAAALLLLLGTVAILLYIYAGA